MTLTGRAGLSALLRAFTHDLGMDLLYVAEDETDQTEQRPIKVRQWRTKDGQVLPKHLSVEMEEGNIAPTDSSEWPEASFLKPSALLSINDNLCRIYVTWWKPLPHVDSIAVRSAPVHFVIFLDAFFHDAELGLPFNDADAVAARYEKQDVDFSSFWPLIQLYGLRIQLNTAGLATRIEAARLDKHSFARLANRVSPHVLQSTLFCARALQSVNHDSKVSRACARWAEREYDLEPTSHEPLGIWTKRTISWIVYLLEMMNGEAPAIDDYLEKARERERVALAHNPHSAPSSPELNRPPHARSYHDTTRDSCHPPPDNFDDSAPKRSRSTRKPKKSGPHRSSRHETRPLNDDGDQFTPSDIEEINRRPREKERAEKKQAPKYTRASDWDNPSPPPPPSRHRYGSIHDLDGHSPPAALRRNSTFGSRGGDGRRGSVGRYAYAEDEHEPYYLSPDEEKPLPPLQRRKTTAPARTRDLWRGEEDFHGTGAYPSSSRAAPPRHDSHHHDDYDSYTDDDDADDYIEPPSSSSRPLSSRPLSSRPLQKPKSYSRHNDDAGDYINPPPSSPLKPLSKPKHKSKPSARGLYEDPSDSSRRRY
ncbi:hypothetical protein JCM10296v2_003831 [Rhodotorula toruloides]